ncbi:MAG: alkaline phosphatase family protein [Anaerolineales bacterium]|nr:alkaline phosphatase family protein [Anaerolineales bacterium]
MPDKKVVLFLVDGMRPDGIMQTDTPAMDAFMQTGAYTFEARTIMPSVTLPCHTSLFYSVPAGRHGITTNVWMPPVRPIPGLFDVLHQAGCTTASFYNWEQLRDLSAPGSLDANFYLQNLHADLGVGDLELVDFALMWFDTHDFNFAFVYMGQTDEVGHRAGWMSQPYLDSIMFADQCLAKLVDNLPDDVHYFVAADHGGHDQTHGTDADEDMLIPLLIKAPDMRAGKELPANISIMDIAPTILDIFGIQPPSQWVGKRIEFDR